ncbi:MAG TPA: DUF6790 family protein [Hyphomicrobium sp.]|nr:DUF6790 family protein [Hyphomicrobium sp.]
MYLAIIVLLMGVLPLVSIAVELAAGSSNLWLLIGKWFVFWAVGLRLLIAGLSQVFKPETTVGILGIKDSASLTVVKELGFANITMGVLGTASLWFPGWLNAAALAGSLFLGLAGVNHLLKGDRNAKENIAMISDLAIAGVLAAYLLVVALR